VSFSPDGQYIATASSDKTGQVWSAKSGEQLFTLVGHEEAVTDIIYSPDGNLIATTGDDMRAKIWDARNGKVLNTLGTINRDIYSIAFSHDGTRLVTAGQSGRIRIYRVAYSSEELIDFGRKRTVRSLTCEERRKYIGEEECILMHPNE
jgi:WD40 repeat protein